MKTNTLYLPELKIMSHIIKKKREKREIYLHYCISQRELFSHFKDTLQQKSFSIYSKSFKTSLAYRSSNNNTTTSHASQMSKNKALVIQYKAVLPRGGKSHRSS